MIDTLRSVGLYSKGVVYLIVGGLTAAAALEMGGEQAGKSATIDFLLNQPFGNALLWVLSAGIIAFVIWRLYAFFVDPKDKGSDAKGWTRRSYALISALIYGSFGFTAVKVALGTGSSGGSGEKKEALAATILKAPGGPYLLGTVGLIVCGFALYQLARGYNLKFLNNLRLTDPAKRDLLERSGRLGYFARAVVFGVIGYFVIRAAFAQNPEVVMGTQGVFGFLHRQSYGGILMAAVAAGLVFYGVYSVLKGAFSRVPHEKPDMPV
jgi:hypothetical protein